MSTPLTIITSNKKSNTMRKCTNKIQVKNSITTSVDSTNFFIKFQAPLKTYFGVSGVLFLNMLNSMLKSDKLGHQKLGGKWIANTFEGWAKEMNYSSRQVQRIVAKLQKMDVLMVEQLANSKWNKTNYYAINFNKLEEILGNHNSFTTPPKIETSSSNSSSSIRQDVVICTKNNINTNLKDLKDSFVNEYKECNSCIPLNDLPPLKGKEDEKPSVSVSLSKEEEEQVVEEVANILDQLDKPGILDRFKLLATLKKRMRQMLGFGKEGVTRFIEYCRDFVRNALLMGKQRMRDGNFFQASIGTILSGKFINDWMDKQGFFTFVNKEEPLLQGVREGFETSFVERPPAIFRRESEVLKSLPSVSIADIAQESHSGFDGQVKRELYQSLGENCYKSWFKARNFKAIGIDSRAEPEFEIDSAFARDHILTHFERQLKQAFTQAASLLYLEEG